jgi:predicted DNA-binding transcriptional regulator AlpA
VTAILRLRAAWQKLGVGRDTFYKKYVRTGRVRLVQVTERTCGVFEDELDVLIEEMRAARDAGPPVSGVPSVRRSVSGRFVSKAKEAESV